MKKIKFDETNKSQIKKRAAKVFIDESGVCPNAEGITPAAVIMAGLPGSGKTEFINTLVSAELIPALKDNFLRIDLDEIVKIFEGYRPQDDHKFRSIGNNIVANIFDKAVAGPYSFILDGTFGGAKAIDNIERLLGRGYSIYVYVMIESVDQAWKYTVEREKKTKRGIDRDGFIGSIEKIKSNLKDLKSNSERINVTFVEKDWTLDRVYRLSSEIDIDELYKI